MESLPVDILLNILEYGSTTEHWSLSRSSNVLYKCLNDKIYKLFRKRFTHRIMCISKKAGFNVGEFINSIEIEDYVFSGSIVLSTLVRQNWDGIKLTVFCKENHQKIINTTENYAPIQSKIYVGFGGLFTPNVYDVTNIRHRGLTIDIIHCRNSIQSVVDDVFGHLSALRCTLDEKHLVIVDPSNTLFLRSYAGKGLDQNTGNFYRERGVVILRPIL